MQAEKFCAVTGLCPTSTCLHIHASCSVFALVPMGGNRQGLNQTYGWGTESGDSFGSGTVSFSPLFLCVCGRASLFVVPSVPSHISRIVFAMTRQLRAPVLRVACWHLQERAARARALCARRRRGFSCRAPQGHEKKEREKGRTNDRNYMKTQKIRELPHAQTTRTIDSFCGFSWPQKLSVVQCLVIFGRARGSFTRVPASNSGKVARASLKLGVSEMQMRICQSLLCVCQDAPFLCRVSTLSAWLSARIVFLSCPRFF